VVVQQLSASSGSIRICEQPNEWVHGALLLPLAHCCYAFLRVVVSELLFLCVCACVLRERWAQKVQWANTCASVWPIVLHFLLLSRPKSIVALAT
jgi:hypothetical protein